MNGLLSKNMRYFIAVMDERNISHAAKNLHITRSPLGKAIIELEEKIGSKLFIRKGSALQPTEHAINLYSRLKPVFESLVSIEDVFFHKKQYNALHLYVDENYPYNLFQGVKSLQYIKETRIKVEKKAFNELTLAEVMGDPRSAFLTLSHESQQHVDDYPSVDCALKKIYLVYANNNANKNKTISNIILEHLIIKNGSIPQQQFSDCILYCFPEKPATLSIIDESIDLASMLNLVGCDEAVSFVPEGFLKFCGDDISFAVINNITLSPRIWCAENSLKYFDRVTAYINSY